jgi:cyclopropane-fatty-acyl-phospholipid synthase
MNSRTASWAANATPPAGATAAGKAIVRLLQRLQQGVLTVRWPRGEVQQFGAEPAHGSGLHASLQVHDWQMCSAALKSGDIGFAESFIAGHWTTPDLPALMRLLIANRNGLETAIYGHWLGRLAYRVRHLLNRNTRDNSRKNIHAHYDLGNRFYELWLDGTMNYSSALFEGDASRSLSEAQHAKVRRALRMARIVPGSRVLEIGCGWGALAEKATTEFGASVTGVTLSTEQLAFAQARMKRLKQTDRSDLRLQDYRDITDAPFDAICSIEMIEAVGQAYWPTYFQTIHRLLKPGGRACIQSIVIDDRLFDRYVKSTDFIQQYIFPGGCLPSPGAFRREALAAGLLVEDELDFGTDYATTCRLWREAFLQRRTEVLAQGFDENFIRTWEFYLAYCEAGFDMGDVSLMQFTLVRP